MSQTSSATAIIESSATKLISKAYNQGRKDGKGEAKTEATSENFKNFRRVASKAAKKADDGKSKVTAQSFGKLVNSKLIFNQNPTAVDAESISTAALELMAILPKPPKKVAPAAKSD